MVLGSDPCCDVQDILDVSIEEYQNFAKDIVIEYPAIRIELDSMLLVVMVDVAVYIEFQHILAI